MTGQSKSMSALESSVNIAVGIGVSFAANIVVLPLVGLPVNLGQASIITVVFTAISFARSYLLRRAFNWWHLRCSNGV